MSIHLEQLEHQARAVEAVLKAMNGCRDFELSAEQANETNNIYANPPIKLNAESLRQAVIDPKTYNLPVKTSNYAIDVKMETGTGKTYVYTRLMYELYKNFELNKFIIFVPSLPIKEGTKNFICADYARQHFGELYENIKIDLCMINAGAFNSKKGKKKILPSELSDYLEGTRNERNTIKCLLINDAMLMSKSMTRDDYDQTLIGSTTCPIEGIKMTRPIVIIDEPHRFKKSDKAYQAIKELKTQLIVRFGATFPDIEVGAGKNKTKKKDYENLVYNLGSVQAFNDGLVKGIDIHYPNNTDDTKYKVVAVNKRDKKITLKKDNKEYEVKFGEKLPDDFGGIELGFNEDNELALNEMKLEIGMDLMPSVLSINYQELLLSQAIDKHFAKEKENWTRENAGANAPKIKTLSLFFIDRIKSYRENDGWLKVKFEELLKKKLSIVIANEQSECGNPEYIEFLQASLQNIFATHAGYFAEDNGKGDEALQAEVDDILRNKDEMLSFKRKDGSWNIRRFLFSKWTLREGWDNPNVFVITKLRTSGSEISKLQEVGRGLRLPVDENGKRLSAEEFRLDYIIDWSEKNFAEKLIGEINSDGGKIFTGKITDEIVDRLIEINYAATRMAVKNKLNQEQVIDDNEQIINSEKLTSLLPDGDKLRKGKIRENESGTLKIKVDAAKWNNIKDLWQKVTRKYLLQFEKLNETELKNILEASVAEDNFVSTSGDVIVKSLEIENGEVVLKSKIEHIASAIGELHYGEFLKRLCKRTDIKVRDWHKVLVSRFDRGIDKNKINVRSLENIIAAFQKEFMEKFAQKYSYQSLDYTANTSLLKNGDFVSEVAECDVGGKEEVGVAIGQNYLWSKALVDSEIEKEIIENSADNRILVFGKIPKKAIRVPTYTGGTTTPDFIYAIKDGGDKVKINLFVEAKSQNMRDTDKIAVFGQEKFFENIEENVRWKKITQSNEINDMINKLA
ncbi:MAG: type III restriction-modification system endonuclease [Campylobacteraceae bacterium]|jgi:type III restriction enzyme|nr:type III restriction-modification system endonuclease [Campylobacteraceae bacterium]